MIYALFYVVLFTWCIPTHTMDAQPKSVALEETDKEISFDQLPDILKALIQKNDSVGANVAKKKLCIPSILRQKCIPCDRNATIYNLHAYGKYGISPQSVTTATKEYYELLNGTAIKPFKPYNEEEERTNLMHLIKQFPTELQKHERNHLTEWFDEKLAFAAYALQEPLWDRLLIGYNLPRYRHISARYHMRHCIMDDILSILAKGDPLQEKNHTATAERITQEFIEIFTQPKNT